MGSRRCVHLVAPFFIASSFFACNALLDNESDRRVDVREAGDEPFKADDPRADDRDQGADEPIIDPKEGGDGPAPVTINVPLSFITPNGASHGPADGGGYSITGINGVNHPVIVPIQQPAIPSDDYTVEAVVRSETDCEYGLMTRFLPDAGGGQLLGTKFGSESKPFIGNMGVPDGWNPSLDSSGQAFTWQKGRFHLRVQAKGSDIKGMIWKEGDQPPVDWQVGIINAKYKTGRGIGFYVYFCYDAALESLKVTVP